MFTGIIEEIGTVKKFSQKGRTWDLLVLTEKITQGLKIGQSVAVNGACLTAVAIQKKKILFELQKETLRCTALGDLKIGEKVNLERALKVGSRLDGHIVQGHVDTVGTVKQLKKIKKDFILTVSLPKKWVRYLVPKGSIAVNGVSLTIVDVGPNTFSTHLIPHTLKKTNLQECPPKTNVNIEVDILAKYLSKLIQ
jgi:riboflavin synthase